MTAHPEDEDVEITQYAEVVAHLAHFPAPRQAEVIARLGLQPQRWTAAAARWTAAREAELAVRKTHLATRFVRVFAATLERLQAEQASLSSIGPLPPGLLPETAPLPDALAVGAAGAPPAVEAQQMVGNPVELGAPPFQARARVQVNAAPAALASTAIAPERPVPVPAAALTLEQYTSLRVELNLLLDRAPLILARYGLDPVRKEALFEHWRVRFEADPPLRMLFARQYAEYLAWIRQNPGALEAIAQRSASVP